VKNKDQVTWLHESGVNYTREEFEDAEMFIYTCEHLPSGAKSTNVIYGVTASLGYRLLEVWNTRSPKWKYTYVSHGSKITNNALFIKAQTQKR
jgi:hypothetical protein